MLAHILHPKRSEILAYDSSLAEYIYPQVPVSNETYSLKQALSI